MSSASAQNIWCAVSRNVLRRRLACASLWEYCLLKTPLWPPCPIPALSHPVPRQKPLCVEELRGLHNEGTAMLAQSSLTLALTVGMWQSVLSRTHTNTCTCLHMRADAQKQLRLYMWQSMCGILTYPDMFMLWRHVMKSSATPRLHAPQTF